MSTSRLCETVTGRSMAELIAARDAATAGDMVELRLDGVEDLDVAGALRGKRRPVIVTCRPEWEGGRFTGAEKDRQRILDRALALGAEHVDIEWATLHATHDVGFAGLIQRDPARIVLSSHDFDGVPSMLDSRVRDMRASGAGVIKVAVTAHKLTDTLPLLDIARDGNAVVIGMGDAGVTTRLLAARFGSLWTYAGNAVAPGQIPAPRLLDEFRFRAVGPQTRLFGVVSSSAMHSLSPALHNAAFAAAGLDAVYVPLQTHEFDDFLQFAGTLGIEGVSVTIPFKGDALRAAASADDLTRQVGAANTLRQRDGEWEAINTDVAGFLAPLEAAFSRPLRDSRIAVIGGGGSARAVIVALLSRGARVSVHTRRPEQALEVTGSLGAEIGRWPVPADSWDVLVNCTPLGGGGRRDESPLPGGPFTGALVYDLTYGPGESALVREAREAGCATLDGLPMLIAQAERQFEWWTGQAPAADVMRDAAYARLGLGRPEGGRAEAGH